MICSACGTENRVDRRFCRSCGVALGTVCPSCGSANEAGDRFCGTCGSVLGAGPAREGAGRAAAAGSGSATPAPTTERRLVSVLFADLVGFTPFAEERDPEAVREVLERYIAAARDRIERYGGTVEKFIGDAVMAVWGTPVAHEDDAERAVRAALDVIDAVAALPIGAAGAGRLRVRAAVLTGEAAVAVGAERESIVAGDLVNTASRLQSVAPPGVVLVDEPTLRASEAAIAYDEAGDQILKGKTSPLRAWRAIRVVGGRRGAGRSARLEAPFVGRDDELRLLKELYDATGRDRRARLVSVTGMAGIGKSRLAWELEKYIDGLVEDVYWHAGRSPAYGDGLAFWALAEMVRGRAGIAEDDGADTARMKLADTLARWLPDEAERAWVEPRLVALLGMGEMPPGGTEELFAAWRTLFERIADRYPTVLVFEDVHWADDGLLDFIEQSVAANRARPILVLTLARAELLERRPTWGAGLRSFSSLELGPLSAEAMELLLIGLAPGLPPPAIAAIGERAEGVPLYAVEMVRMLLDQGRLTERDGRYRLVGDLGLLEVPASLTALLGARIDALPEAERVLLGHAAVLGLTFTAPALAAATGSSEAGVRAALDGLIARDLVVLDEDPRSPERGQFGFIQGLLREVAYARLSRRERLARHEAAADYFASLADEDVGGVVATHLLEAHRASEGPDAARLADRARGALLGAADRAIELHAWGRAVGYLDDASAIATDEPERMAILERTVATGLEGAVSLARIEDDSRVLLAWQDSRGDRDGTARAARYLGTAMSFAGRPDDARAAMTPVYERLAGAATPDVVALGAELARAHLMASDARSAEPLVEVLLRQAERLDERDTLAHLFATKAWVLGSLGRPIEAIALLRGALDFASREGFIHARLRAAMNLSNFLYSEDPRDGFSVAFDAMTLAQRLGYVEWAISLAGNAMTLARLTGDWQRSVEIARDFDPAGSEGAFAAAILCELAMVAAYRGRFEEAAATLAEASALPSRGSDPQMEALLAVSRAHLELARGDGDALREAMAGLSALTDTSQDRLCFLAHGVLWTGGPEAVERLPGWDEYEAHGRMARAAWAAIGAAVDAASGRSEQAALRFDSVARELRALDARFVLAIAQLQRAIYLRDRPGAAEAAAEARALLEALGARPLLERLEAAGWWAVGPAPAAADVAPGATRAEVGDPA